LKPYDTEEQIKIFCFAPELKEENFYNLGPLNPNLKKAIRYHLTRFWKFRSCSLPFLKIFTLFAGIYNCIKVR